VTIGFNPLLPNIVIIPQRCDNPNEYKIDNDGITNTDHSTGQFPGGQQVNTGWDCKKWFI
jgi:hypothetical protein